MYKVTNMSASALHPTTLFFFFGYIVVYTSVWLYEQGDMIPCLWLPDICIKLATGKLTYMTFLSEAGP